MDGQIRKVDQNGVISTFFKGSVDGTAFMAPAIWKVVP